MGPARQPAVRPGPLMTLGGARSKGADRPTWRRMLDRARAVALLAGGGEAMLAGPGAPAPVLDFRADLRGAALLRFPVEGESVESARLAFVALSRAVLGAGMPAVRRRLAVALAVLVEELDGLLDDQAASETAAGLNRLGLGDR